MWRLGAKSTLKGAAWEGRPRTLATGRTLISIKLSAVECRIRPVVSIARTHSSPAVIKAENWASIALIETCKLPEIERRRSATVLYQCIAQGAAYDSIGR
jgi:hypothetical protein